MRCCSTVLAVCILAFSACAMAQVGDKAQTSPHRPLKSQAPALPPVTLPTEPGLFAVIYASIGYVVCRLFDIYAPKTVANFLGLASGTKAWTDPATGATKHTPLYSGTTFHRVIPGFMIQGG